GQALLYPKPELHSVIAPHPWRRTASYLSASEALALSAQTSARSTGLPFRFPDCPSCQGFKLGYASIVTHCFWAHYVCSSPSPGLMGSTRPLPASRRRCKAGKSSAQPRSEEDCPRKRTPQSPGRQMLLGARGGALPERLGRARPGQQSRRLSSCGGSDVSI